VKLIIPAVTELLADDAEAVILIKPQFEAGKDKVGKNGVVRDMVTHINVVEDIINFLTSNGYCIKGLTYSPVKGPKGNIEFLVYVGLGDESVLFDIESVVRSAHTSLSEV
jgi:23S rRNA (cytidine1920-2'-O)/16S rRNA (cytidine1409-2'-O)-methyltransferase